MAEREKFVYDGKTYHKIEYSEILKNDYPTGHYKLNLSQQTTVLGTYLDAVENQKQLKEDIKTLEKTGIFSNIIFMITDKKGQCFLLSRQIGAGISGNLRYSSIYDWVIDIIQTLGYVNHPHLLKENPLSIEITITPKNGSKNYKIYLMSADSQCSKLS